MTYPQLTFVADAFAECINNLDVELVLTNIKAFKFLEVLQISEEDTDTLFVFDTVVLEGKSRELLHFSKFFSGFDGCIFGHFLVAYRELVQGCNSYIKSKDLQTS